MIALFVIVDVIVPVVIIAVNKSITTIGTQLLIFDMP